MLKKVLLKNKQTGPLLYFVCLVIISHIVLPSLNKNEILPFFDWGLFTSKRSASHFDLKIKTANDEFFLSEDRNFYINKYLRNKLWFFLQNEKSRDVMKKKLTESLKSFLNTSFELCEIQKPMVQHVLEKEKSVFCEKI